MLKRRTLIGAVFLLVLALFASIGAVTPVIQADPLPPLRRINAPYLGPIYMRYTAIAWFGQITPDENYSDIRVGYNNQEIYIDVTTFDRRLWYDTSPTAADLTNWDAVSIYLNKDGNAGSAPGASAYRFDGQLNWWEARPNWQTAYRGNGSQWVTTPLSFTTAIDFAWDSATVGGLNVDQNDRGWRIEYRLPFSAFGLSGPPPQGTIWGLGVAVHDRDSAAGPPRADRLWPSGVNAAQPATWGQLHFGLPEYVPSASVQPSGQATIRHGLNGAVVKDGTVGGHTNCGSGLNYWTQWPNQNYAGVTFFNVQNQVKIADWPCFAKTYLTFPLHAVPAGKVIISATVTLRQFGNAGAGWNPGPQPSFIQVLSVGEDWDENTLNWNNAPLPRENWGILEVDPLANPGYPGVPRTWDVSGAAAEAYAAGEPLRLAFYSADSDMHSGRYFYSSEADPEVRPTLNVIWGNVVGRLQVDAQPAVARQTDRITYTLTFLGDGSPMTVTDQLPAEVSAPGALSANAGTVAYVAGTRQVWWTGTPSAGEPITITYPVTVLVSAPMVIVNQITLNSETVAPAIATVYVVVNPRQVWLPVLRK